MYVSINSIYMYIYIYISIWVNYNDLTTTSLEIMVSKGNHPQMALIQVSEILEFTQKSMYIYIYGWWFGTWLLFFHNLWDVILQQLTNMFQDG